MSTLGGPFQLVFIWKISKIMIWLTFDYYFFVRKSEAHQVVQLPSNGIPSLTYGGDNGNGQDLYATAITTIIDAFTATVSQINSPGTSLYKISGVGKGEHFERLKCL